MTRFPFLSVYKWFQISNFRLDSRHVAAGHFRAKLEVMSFLCYTRIHEIVRCIRFSSRKWGDQHECLWGIVVDDCVCNVDRAGYFSSLIWFITEKNRIPSGTRPSSDYKSSRRADAPPSDYLCFHFITDVRKKEATGKSLTKSPTFLSKNNKGTIEPLCTLVPVVTGNPRRSCCALLWQNLKL